MNILKDLLRYQTLAEYLKDFFSDKGENAVL